MQDNQGASAKADRAGGPADLSRCASQPEALIPCAYRAEPHESGWWVVTRNGREIDDSGDGGFYEGNAKLIAAALNAFTRDSDTRPKDGDAKQDSTRE